jgi:RHS repeat-associated protein
MKNIGILGVVVLILLSTTTDLFGQCQQVILDQPDDATVCSSDIFGMNVTASFAVNALGGTTFAWYWSSTPGGSGSLVPNSAPFSGVNTKTLTVTRPSTSYSGEYWLKITYSCGATQNSARAKLTVKSPPGGMPGTISGRTVVNRGEQGVAYASTSVAYATSYEWSIPEGVRILSGDGTRNITLEFTNQAISGPITAYGKNESGCFSSRLYPQPFEVTVNPHSGSSDMNYIVTSAIKKDNVYTAEDIGDIPENVNESYVYFDGLGRAIQKVAWAASPLQKDIVEPIEYDASGRQNMKYLPYVPGDVSSRYKLNSVKNGTNYAGSGHNLFYSNGTVDKITDDQAPYAKALLEESMLNRIIKSGSPGQAWQPNNSPYNTPTDNSIAKSYETNEDSEVLKWTYSAPTASLPFGLVNAGTAASPVYYEAGQLQRNKTKDEAHNEVIEYKNKEGLLVLKRIQVVSGTHLTTGANKDVNFASTYYIYDNLKKLVCVIPPQAVALITQTTSEYFDKSDSDKNAFLNRWSYRYTYDTRTRMTQKHIPGVEPTYFVYDPRDRIVLTQDGNQRTGATNAAKYWSFTKYDEFNRPIATGIKDTTTAVQLTQAQMQAAVNEFYRLMHTTKPWRKWGERYIGTDIGNVHGYSNKSYPISTSAAVVNHAKYIAVTYYDNYAFKTLWGKRDFVADTISQKINGSDNNFPSVANDRVLNRITGLKVKVLDGGNTGGYTWLKTVNYYDDRYRNIQIITDNFKGGVDRTSNLYDFSGRLLVTKVFHNTLMWKDMLNTKTSLNKLIRSGGSQGWNTSGAASVQQLAAGEDGWIEFTTSEYNVARMIGFSDQNTNADYTTMDYAIYLQNNGRVNVYENGSSRLTTPPAFSVGDVFRIERINGAVKFYHNGNVLHPSTVPSSTALMADVAFYPVAATALDVRISARSHSTVVTKRFKYDHADRLTRTYHQVNSDAYVLLSKTEYNEIGQPVDQTLHSVNGNAPKQSIDFRYNVRGWLTSINDASLTQDGSDPKDFFGEEISFNNPFTGVNDGPEDKLYFNGNISAIKWSKNSGFATVKENAQVFTYDPINRLKTSTFKEKSVTWNVAPNNAYSETDFSYDLNGNITALKRNDNRASGWMDNLEFKYGTGSATAQSNKLMRVQDSGEDYAGFIDGNPDTSDDYTYDLNGNMLTDKNKGITTPITYNFLDLPELITRGTNTLRYVYDATGRKLSQLVTFNSSSKQSDYVNEFFYENEALKFIAHQAGRVAIGTETTLFKHDGNDDEGAIEGFLFQNTSSSSSDVLNGNQTYIRVTSNGTAIGGVLTFGQNFPAQAGDQFKIRVNGYRTGTQPVYIQARTNLGNITWNGSWLGASLPSSLLTESWIEQTITIPTGGNFIAFGLLWNTATAGDQFFINDVEIIKLGSAAPEYQYDLRDHIGNVRVTFTSKDEIDNAVATLETAASSFEQSKFLRYTDARRVKSQLLDHTNDGTEGYAQRLSGGSNEKFGLARSISVMPGDVVKMQVYAKYIDPVQTNVETSLRNFISQIVAGTAPAGTVIDGSSYGQNPDIPFPNVNGTETSTGTGPKAFLNYIMFDRNFKPIPASVDPSQTNYVRVTEAAKEDGTTNLPEGNSHELLTASVVVKEAGYMYTYLSNEESSNVEVYFDDFEVTQTKSPIIRSDDYYPFGNSFNSYVRENTLEQQFRFNGKETQDELGINWLDYGARMYDPDLGRWNAVDPRADEYDMWSPYAFSANNPELIVDPDGERWWIMVSQDEKTKKWSIWIWFTGAVYNKSGKQLDMERVRNEIHCQIQTIFSKVNQDDVVINTVVNLKVVESLGQVLADDHLITIVSNEFFDANFSQYFAKGVKGGGISDIGGLKIFIPLSTIEKTMNGTNTYTIAHEVGHTGGLYHPADKPFTISPLQWVSLNPKDQNADVYNLMHTTPFKEDNFPAENGDDPNLGTALKLGQYRAIHENFKKGRLNKPTQFKTNGPNNTKSTVRQLNLEMKDLIDDKE